MRLLHCLLLVVAYCILGFSDNWTLAVNTHVTVGGPDRHGVPANNTSMPPIYISCVLILFYTLSYYSIFVCFHVFFM